NDIDQSVLGDTIISCLIFHAESVCADAVNFKDSNCHDRDRKIDKILTGKFTAFPVMLLLLGLIFWITVTGANYPSAILSDFLFSLEKYLVDFFELLKFPKFLYEMLVYGMYRVLAWVVSVMLPPMAIFFPLFTILEDIGYLPRVAFNLDKCFKSSGTCGKQALTMCMGLGCNAAGVTGCRIIDSKRERLIAILTNSFMPCNGRIPTLIAISTMFIVLGDVLSSSVSTLTLVLLIVLSVFITLAISKFLSKTLLKGVASSFTLELPPYRKPQFLKVIVHSIFDRTIYVLARAVSVAAPAGVIIWLLANISIGNVSLLHHCTEFLDPFAHLFGLDGVILMAFILGLPANEIVIPLIVMTYSANGILSQSSDIMQMKDLFLANGWTFRTAICVMIFMLIHWPCSTTLLTIKKETGSIKWMLSAFLIPTIIGLILCFVFFQISSLFI
ncbi:MAG: nucleoside recognition domain-containing protein, partial [Oscillospiraceae bacterium]